MSTQSEEAPAQVAPGAPSPAQPAWVEQATLERIPPLRTPLNAAEVSKRLDQAARRARLPGLKLGPEPGSFRVRLFGGQFDRMLHVTMRDIADGCMLDLRAVLLPVMPTLFAVIIAFTIWPGVWLMDSMLTTYWPASQNWWPTWTWYLPLTILPLPFAVRKLWRASREAATEDLRKTLTSIARETGAQPGNFD